MSNSKWIAELKTVLQVTKARLDVREKKKTEKVAKERYVVADYVRNNKVPRARIAVEHLIREDYTVEAMDRIEAYVDTLIMRIQLIKDRPKNGLVNPAVEQPLSNILWAAPILAGEIPELAQVTTMFKKHMGAEYVTASEQNKLSMVDADLIRCLSCEHVPKILIEKYLVEICRSQNVPFEPDPTIMAQDEFWAIGQRYVHQATNNDEKRFPPPPSDASSFGGGGGIGAPFDASNAHALNATAPQLEKPPPAYSTINSKNIGDHQNRLKPNPQYPVIHSNPSLPRIPPVRALDDEHSPGHGPKQPFHDPFPQVPNSKIAFNPPPPPTAPGDGSDDTDFDNLARRFEDLKKRK